METGVGVKLAQIEFSPDGDYLFAVAVDGTLWVTPLMGSGGSGQIAEISQGGTPKWKKIETPVK